MQHVHQQGRKYICEFCFLLEQAQGRAGKGARRILYLICICLLVSGVLLLILRLNNVLAVALIIGGIAALGGAASSFRAKLPLRRGFNPDADAELQRRFDKDWL